MALSITIFSTGSALQMLMSVQMSPVKMEDNVLMKSTPSLVAVLPALKEIFVNQVQMIETSSLSLCLGYALFHKHWGN